MTDAKTRTAESITKARIELDRALAELDALRTFDPALLGVVAHAMSNYITVTTATRRPMECCIRFAACAMPSSQIGTSASG